MKTKSKAEEEKRGRGRFRGFLRTLIALFVIGLIVIAIGAGFFLQQQQKIIRSLEASIEALKMTTIPLRFMVLSRSDTEISARFKFYNADSREIASFERSWKGSELYIDSLVVPLKTGALVFPVRVFTDAVAPRGGTMLLNYYDFDGMPGIYDSASQDGQKRLMLKELFTKLKASEGLYGTNTTGNPGSRLLNYFGNAVHDIKQLRQFEIGTVYSLVIHSYGGIEIMSE
ncbi:MAG: hypothetical protein LDL24_10970 [Treponema sp.]|nr:hypothetical protein [Treponema sp.]